MPTYSCPHSYEMHYWFLLRIGLIIYHDMVE
jgi:hypothetical protein